MNHPLRSDNWEATDPKHGARVCCDCSGQPSSNRRPNSQVGRLEASCPTRLSRECASRLGTANIDENKYNDRRNTKTRVEKCSMQLNFLLCLSLIMAMCRSMPCLYYLWTEIFNHLWHTQTCTRPVIRSTPVSSSSSASPSLYWRSSVGPTSWDSPSRLSLPSFSFSGTRGPTKTLIPLATSAWVLPSTMRLTSAWHMSWPREGVGKSELKQVSPGCFFAHFLFEAFTWGQKYYATVVICCIFSMKYMYNMQHNERLISAWGQQWRMGECPLFWRSYSCPSATPTSISHSLRSQMELLDDAVQEKCFFLGGIR